MAQLMPLPLTVSCFCKIQVGFTFLVPAHPGSPGQRAAKRVCVCVCLRVCLSASVSLEQMSDLHQFFVHVAYECGLLFSACIAIRCPVCFTYFFTL